MACAAPVPEVLAQPLGPAQPQMPPSPSVDTSAAYDAADGVRQWQPSFRELGMANALRLRGVDGQGSLGLGIRRDEMVQSARLRLRFTLSPALLPELSHLKVLLNDQMVQTLALPKQLLGQPQEVSLDIDPAYFVDYNQLRFQFIGHYSLECEDPDHSSLWAEISAESTLDLRLSPLPSRPDLAVLPAPFFDARDSRPVQVPFVYGAQPSQGQLKAAGSVASWLGTLASYRGNRFPVFEDQLPPGHAIVIATNDRRPSFLQGSPPVDQPTLSLVSHPRQPGALLLLVLGRDDEQVQTAAEALALGRAALSGQTMRVAQLQHPAPRKAYDAPRWVSTERPVLLGELVDRPQELQLRGAVLHDTIRINARMAPDLFTWNTRGVPLKLLYQYTPTAVSDHGLLSVEVNNEFLKSYPLRASGGNHGKADVLILPLSSDEGAERARSNLRIPVFMVGGNNQLQFTFQIPPASLGRCRSTQPVELRAALDPQSTLDMTGFHHYMAMPNLAAFANSGFPFTKYADLAQTSVVLPGQPSKAEVQLYLSALGRMGAATGYPATRFQLLHPEQLEQARGTDILLVSEGDRDGLLERWSADLPALVGAGRRSVQPLTHAATAFAEMFRSREGGTAVAPQGQTLLEGNGSLAALTGRESPLDSGRSVVVLAASDAQGMGLIDASINTGASVQRIHGDLALLRGDVVESFRVRPSYYTGYLPWWKKLWFHLHGHPVWMALAGIGAGMLLTLLAYGALRALAQRRLEDASD